MPATPDNPYDIFSQTGNHALFHQIRAEDPVHCAIGPNTGNRFWFIMRYDDCSALIKDQRIGKDWQKYLPPELKAQWGEPSETYRLVTNHMLNTDPPDHTRLRTLVNKAFTPAMIRKNTVRIEEICSELLDAVDGQDSMDILEDYGAILPVMVIAEMLGVPSEDHERFREWTKHIIFDDFETALGLDHGIHHVHP